MFLSLYSIDSYKSNRDNDWWLDEREDGEPFGLAILAMTSDEAITLRSDIMVCIHVHVHTYNIHV